MVAVSRTTAMEMQSSLFSILPEAAMLQSVYRNGSVVTSEKIIAVEKVLFDTGALQASYVSRSFVEKFRKYIRLIPASGIICMADNKTKVKVENLADLDVEFEHDDGNIFRATIQFVVFDTEGHDMIIGLPHILKHFLIMFVDMLKEGLTLLYDGSAPGDAIQNLVQTMTQTPQYASGVPLVVPWTHMPEVSPEEVNDPDPCAFSGPLHFMELSHDEAMKEYLSLLDTHIDPAFDQATPIREYLTNIAHRAFVKQEWTGVNGVKPIELEFHEGMPRSIKPRARPIPPKLIEPAQKEFERLRKYFWVPSTSPIASCLVIAPKATKPFIRFCGDHREVNKWVKIGHYPIPRPILAIERMRVFKYYVDIDWTNSFHQLPLSKRTSEILSVQTPWGQFEPLFMPEGVGPASGILQATVAEIFSDFDEWSVCIFDNILIGGHDYADLFEKTKRVIERCIERNVCLKMAKSWFGKDSAEFFGYVLNNGTYEISEKRKTSISEIPFPKDKSGMRRFLGAALYCKPFIPGYSDLTATLNDTLKDNFRWEQPDDWKGPYKEAYEAFKQALINACKLYFPNYELEWILRTDASIVGASAALFQVFPNNDGSVTLQPISFVSHKFSETASRWSTLEQECFAIKYGVESMAYYLRGKEFILETDHENLRWMEASEVAKIIRWRMFLQGFTFKLRHIPGKLNKVADWLSRVHSITCSYQRGEITDLDVLMSDTELCILESEELPEPDMPLCVCHHISHTCQECVPVDDKSKELGMRVLLNQLAETPELTPQQTIEQLKFVLQTAHGGRKGHFGVQKTYRELIRMFPGQNIPYKIVADFVATCPVCQKERLGLVDQLMPLVRHLKPPHKRSVVGVDNLSITPEDKNGNANILVLVNHFTKHVHGYPTPKSPDAKRVAQCLYEYYCTFGTFDVLMSDPGSDLLSKAVEQLNDWLGVERRISLVDRHESNGVEGTNKQILRHLRCICMDERVHDRWSDPEIFYWVLFIINSSENSETGVIPFHAMFGQASETYFKIPDSLSDRDRTHEYVRLLNDNLEVLRQVSSDHQQRLVRERTAANPTPEQHTRYQKGDLVLVRHNPGTFRDFKLHPQFEGPFEVVSQSKNDVQMQHVALKHYETHHVDDIKIFHGSPAEALRVATLDKDQHVIVRFLGYRGDPLKRTTMEFEIEFQDGTIHWVPWSKDLFDSVQYGQYCEAHRELTPLYHDAKRGEQLVASLKKQPITEVQPGPPTYYVDLRSYGEAWYQSLNLPDAYHTKYVFPHVYTAWSNRTRTKIDIKNILTGEEYRAVDHWFVFAYGMNDSFDSSKMTLINDTLLTQYPAIYPTSRE